MRRAFVVVLAILPVLALADPAGGFLADFGPDLNRPDRCPNPEGIALDRAGFVYASSFAFAPSANICVLDRAGHLVDTIPVAAGTAPVASLLGMLFVPGDGLYVTDFANGVAPNGRLLRVDRRGRVEEIAAGFAAPNAIAIDRSGALYVSDSFAGTITRVRPDGSCPDGSAGGFCRPWASDPLLTTQGSPPFGANGVAFDADERFLYVANTGDTSVLRIPVLPGGRAGSVRTFARGADLDAAAGTTGALHGADGIAFDGETNLWVCANQANEIQVLSPGGEILARYRGAGAAALDFPASLVFEGRTLYLTNLSLATGGIHSKLSVMRAPFRGAPLVP